MNSVTYCQDQTTDFRGMSYPVLLPTCRGDTPPLPIVYGDAKEKKIA